MTALQGRVTSDGAHICPTHGEYHPVVLTTGIYTFCDPCADEQIEARSVENRAYLVSKGYDVDDLAHGWPGYSDDWEPTALVETLADGTEMRRGAVDGVARAYPSPEAAQSAIERGRAIARALRAAHVEP